MQPGKHQRSKQRFQDLCWKVHDCAKSFVSRSFTMPELHNQNVSIGEFLSHNQQKSTIVFCARSRPKKRTRTYNGDFIGFHNHSPL